MKEIVLPTDAENMVLEAEFIELLALVPVEDRSGILCALNEIAFPAGATRVRAGDAPRLIATAMYPNSKVASAVIHSIALSPAGAGELNILSASMETMRMSVEISQYEKIRSSILGGTMEAFSGSGVSINRHASGREVDDAFILIAALKDYCAKFGVTVRVADWEMVQPDTKAKLPIAQSMPTEIIKPISRTAAQDAAILAAIWGMKLDPQRLEKPLAGRCGVKADIRKPLLKDTDTFISAKVFATAWQRLLDNSEIRYVERPACK